MIHDSPEIERKILSILDELVELPHDEWDTRAAELARGDPQLLNRVLAVLDATISRKHSEPLQTGGAGALADAILVPECIGPYKVLREIGKGGMGTVFLCQKPGEDFDHLVAIKLVSIHEQSSEVIDTLRWERRTLAKLKHPNIAQMYDGGETEDGAPYLVMEYVVGTPLDEYLAGRTLSLDARLSIFRDCCTAISFAHRNLVVHRDISPRNILVTESGETKVIDFGIATSLQTKNSNPIDLRRPQTKGYAAPERQAVDTPSTTEDIYSLGRILRLLVAGEKKDRGNDLDAIIEKACSASPEDRYQNIENLASDLAAYSTGHSVEAVGGGSMYKLKRLVARNPIGVVLSVAALSTGIGAIVIMAALWTQSAVAERQAQKRFNDVREIANFIMFDLHDEIADLQGSALAREKLVNRSLNYLDELAQNPTASADLKIEVALGYKRLAEIVGNPGYVNLGYRNDAGELLTKANTIVKNVELDGNAPENALSADLQIMIARIYYEILSNGDNDAALLLLQDAISMFNSLGTPSIEDQLYLGDGYALASLATLHTDVDASVDWALRARAQYLSIPDVGKGTIRFRLALVKASSSLGEALAWQAYAADQVHADYTKSLQYFDESLDEVQSLISSGHDGVKPRTYLLTTLLKRSNTACYAEAHLEDGIENIEQARMIAEELIRQNPETPYFRKLLSFVLRQAADCYAIDGRDADAVSAIHEAVVASRALLGLDPSNANHLLELLNAELVQMTVLDATGEHGAACNAAQETLETWRTVKDLHPTLNSAEIEVSRADASAYLEGCVSSERDIDVIE